VRTSAMPASTRLVITIARSWRLGTLRRLPV
jgi:hypothetical protein